MSKKVYVNLEKHKPIIISAKDRYRKGIEVDFCSRCESISVITYYDGVGGKFCKGCLRGLEKDQEGE